MKKSFEDSLEVEENVDSETMWKMKHTKKIFFQICFLNQKKSEGYPRVAC